MDKIDLNKTVFEKREYNKVIDTSFNQLTLKSIPPPIPSADASIEQFFKMYNELFYDIPEFGETNSHEYLIKQSSAYIGFQQENEDIQALLDEIASLRQENLDLLKQQLPSS
jgi:hypothetical protein